MLTYIIRRLLLMIPTLIGMTAVVFFIMGLSPGGVGGSLLSEMGELEAEKAKALREYYNRRYGLDQPLIVQYGRWLNRVSPVGFRTSSQIEFSEDELAKAHALLSEAGLTATRTRREASLSFVKGLAAYNDADLVATATRFVEAMKQPQQALLLLEELDAEPRADFVAKYEHRLLSDPEVALDLLLRELADQAANRDQVLFGRPAFKAPDLGESLMRGRPVVDLYKEALPVTLLLNLVSTPIIYIVAIVTGIYAARHRGKVVDVSTGTVMLGLWSVPTIWAGVMLIGFLANEEYLRWFPAGGLSSAMAQEMPFFPRGWAWLRSLGFLLNMGLWGVAALGAAVLATLPLWLAAICFERIKALGVSISVAYVACIAALLGGGYASAVFIGTAGLVFMLCVAALATYWQEGRRVAIIAAVTAVIVAIVAAIGFSGVLPDRIPDNCGWLMDRLWHLILPVLCLTYGGFAFLSKLTRAAMLENLSSDFVRTARAKGLAERAILWQHAFRNSLLPLITIAAFIVPGLLVGSVIVESIFSIPGMGRLTIDAIYARDRELVLAGALISGLLTLFFLIIADVCYALADPRVSFES